MDSLKGSEQSWVPSTKAGCWYVGSARPERRIRLRHWATSSPGCLELGVPLQQRVKLPIV